MVRNTGRTLTVNFTVVASLAAPITRQCTIQLDPNMTAQSEIFVPTTENWVLTDMYVTTTAFATTGDPMIQFIKDRGITMGTSGVLSTSLVTNNTRPRFLPSPIGFEGGTILSMQAISTVDYVTPLETGKFYVAVDIT